MKLHVAETELKKCKLEVVGGCLCWRVESSDVVIPDNDKIRF